MFCVTFFSLFFLLHAVAKRHGFAYYAVSVLLIHAIAAAAAVAVPVFCTSYFLVVALVGRALKVKLRSTYTCCSGKAFFGGRVVYRVVFYFCQQCGAVGCLVCSRHACSLLGSSCAVSPV